VVRRDAQSFGVGLGLLAGGRVDDARARQLGHQLQDGLLLDGGVVEGQYGQVDLGAVEPVDEPRGLPHPQPVRDLLAYGRRGGRGERRHDGPARQAVDHLADAQIVRAEVVSPR
jgi:hypothetical protein